MTQRTASPFNAFGVLALLLVGFGALATILYLIGMGDTGPEYSQNGGAHALSKGLNGYSALVELVEADGFDTDLTREASDLETADLLVITPPPNADPEKLARLITTRRDLGPTLVIVPKWFARRADGLNNLEDPDAVKDGWVWISDVIYPVWINTEYVPFAFALESNTKQANGGETDGSETNETPSESPPRFATRGPIAGVAGDLPDARGWYATEINYHEPLIVDQAERPLAMSYYDPSSSGEDAGLNWVVFVVEPDLVNNWGLADPDRAKAALSIIRLLGDDWYDRVVFDLTFNGFGGTMNLLTLAFQPPFLAATICLILALMVLGWRAFLRFGPSAVPARETAFGKASLVTNGADLIVRAGRFNLLAEPYIKLSEQRLGAAHTGALPEDPSASPISAPADAMRRAAKPAEILRAARALYRHSQDT